MACSRTHSSTAMLLRMIMVLALMLARAGAAVKASRPAPQTTIMREAPIQAASSTQDVLEDVLSGHVKLSTRTAKRVRSVHTFSHSTHGPLLRRLRGGADSEEEASTHKGARVSCLKQLPRSQRAIPALLTIAGVYCILHAIKSNITDFFGFLLSVSMGFFSFLSLGELAGLAWPSDPVFGPLLFGWVFYATCAVFRPLGVV